MDFIDDFIQEYKNNPCLWKADCANFKNRTKRQEAYMKLIEVAAKHGEHYNIERTKQKINNLRCAFRHQLRKILESKTKGEKDEQYCPKRRYFESLMFLKDEENLDKRQKRDASNSTRNSDENESQLNVHECTSSFEDTNVCQSKDKLIDSLVDSPKETTQVNDNASNATKCFSFALSGQTVSDNFVEDRCQHTNAISPVGEDNLIGTEVYDYGAESSACPAKQTTCRKRSSSLSSQLSKEAETSCKKTLKVDFSAMDFDKVFSVACRSIHNNMDDHFSNFGKIIAHKLRVMEPTQALYAEKIISDVLFHGQMQHLTASNISQFLNTDSYNMPCNK